MALNSFGARMVWTRFAARRRMLLVDECKWRRRVTLGRPGEDADGGRCILEKVTWS